jgi:thymidylate synthase
MSDGFPLLTTKKMAFNTITTELLWFLRGDTNIKFLVDNNCHIWDGDAYQSYLKNWKPQPVVENELHWMEQELVNDRPLPKDMFIHCIKKDDEFAKKWGDLGPIYGKQWRNWNGNGSPLTKDYEGNVSSYLVKPIDQIANLINDLKTNPDSRRLMVNAWNVGELDQMTLPPCHYGFQVYTRELSLEERHYILTKTKLLIPISDDVKDNWIETLNEKNIPTRAISLMWNQRSCDFPLGIPANIMSYALLLMMLSKQVNMVPEELIGNLGDCHIYLNQIDGVKEQLTREPLPLPNVILSDRVVNDLSEYIHTDIILENYQSHPKIYFPLSN